MDYHTSFLYIKNSKQCSDNWGLIKAPFSCFKVNRIEESEKQGPNNNADKTFHYFLKNSYIELISDSSAFGFVYKCTFKKNPEKSPYFYLNTKGENKDVTSIVIKCLLINNRKDNESDDDHYWQYNKTFGKQSKRHFDIKNRFINEVNTQIEISKLGIKSLNRNAPIVLFSSVYDHNNSKELIKTIKHRLKNEPENKPFSQMIHEFDNRLQRNSRSNAIKLAYSTSFEELTNLNYYFGIIAMEYIQTPFMTFYNVIKPIIVDDITLRLGCENIHRYDSLSLSKHSKRLRWAYNTGRYEVLRMALDTGYSEGDYHTDNLLIDENCRKSILIDYGKAKLIEHHNKIISLWKNRDKKRENIKEILKQIFYTSFKDDEHGREFKWLYDIDDADIEIIEYLNGHRRSLVDGQKSDFLLEIMNENTTFYQSKML